MGNIVGNKLDNEVGVFYFILYLVYGTQTVRLLLGIFTPEVHVLHFRQVRAMEFGG